MEELPREGEPSERVIVLHPTLKKGNRGAAGRNVLDRLEEAVGLAHAIDLDVFEKRVIPLAEIRPATLLGKGKVEELGEYIEANEIKLAIVDSALTPVQQRNLETEWKCKVIDRTALILEIFADRARTKEGKLQVELAQLSYQKSRLVRSWTHLERQRGGFGFMGGPGETQIEADRRLIGDRIIRLKEQLEDVVKTRALHRKVRRDTPYPQVALVGYTNAGKSTLFNYLTGAGVIAENKLFATLDPTLRSLELPSGITIILSDTVGFISDLPTELIAAFRATLEEVIEADILLHVRDISHPDTQYQKEDVLAVLAGIRGEDVDESDIVEVWNKTDLLTPEQQENLELRESENKAAYISISALTGAGVDRLIAMLDTRLRETLYTEAKIQLSAADGKAIAWLYAHGDILETTPNEDGSISTYHTRLSPSDLARFLKLFPTAKSV